MYLCCCCILPEVFFFYYYFIIFLKDLFHCTVWYVLCWVVDAALTSLLGSRVTCVTASLAQTHIHALQCMAGRWSLICTPQQHVSLRAQHLKRRWTKREIKSLSMFLCSVKVAWNLLEKYTARQTNLKSGDRRLTWLVTQERNQII